MPDCQCEEVPLVEKCCKFCDLIFLVCQCCDKRYVYCCDECREISRTIAHRRVQSKYRTSPKGKKTNRLGAQKRRIQSNQKPPQPCQIEPDEKSVADRGTILPKLYDMVVSLFSDKEPRCHFCKTKGTVVKHFPPRGYGRGTLLKSKLNPEFWR